MYIFLKLFFVLLFVTNAKSADISSELQKIKSSQVLNQVLFYESKQSWTSRDQELFEKLRNDLLHRSRISQFTESANEDFLLSRLTAREASLFEVTPSKFRLTELQRKSLGDFSAKEIEEELNQIGLADGLINLKEDQLKLKLRFKTWFDLLKRKYQVKVKSADFN